MAKSERDRQYTARRILHHARLYLVHDRGISGYDYRDPDWSAVVRLHALEAELNSEYRLYHAHDCEDCAYYKTIQSRRNTHSRRTRDGIMARR